MRRSLRVATFSFARGDLRRLFCALDRTREARVFRRIQAVLLVARRQRCLQAAQTTGLDRGTVYRLLHRYLAHHQIADLKDRPRHGRPSSVAGLTRGKILQALRRSPLKLGYRTNVWTVESLTLYLNQRHGRSWSARVLRRRMKQIGLVCKRPRYFYSEKDPHRAQKKGGHHTQAQPDAHQCGAAL